MEANFPFFAYAIILVTLWSYYAFFSASLFLCHFYTQCSLITPYKPLLDAISLIGCRTRWTLFDLTILCSQAQGRKPPSNQTFKHDLSRSNLLDALRHSQTRARKAEMEAQKSHDENEHIIKLLFRQASHLFAYRQWLQMWQWQNLLLQHQLKDHSISTRMPLKGKHKEGSKNQKCEICKFAVAFAVGLGLVSAGLLLGWTIGCWFPPV